MLRARPLLVDDTSIRLFPAPAQWEIEQLDNGVKDRCLALYKGWGNKQKTEKHTGKCSSAKITKIEAVMATCGSDVLLDYANRLS